MPTIAELIAAQRQAAAASTPPSVAASSVMAANREQRRQAIDTSGSAFGQAFASRMASSVANIPDVIANIAARSVNNAAQMPDFLNPANYQPPSSRDVRNVQPSDPMIPVPTLGQEFVPGPTGSDLLGLAQRGGEMAGAVATGDFNQFRPNASAQQQSRTQAMAEQSPVASILGSISGDIMTLMTMRAPIASSRGMANLNAAEAAKLAAQTKKSVALAPSVSGALRMATEGSSASRTLLNRMGRIAETGLEGFALSALNGQSSPVETAAFAAGTQAAGSMLLGTMKGLFSGDLTRVGIKLAGSAVAMGALTELARSGTMGVDDPVGSLATGFDKVMLMLATGVVSGAAGMGRVTNKFPVTALPQVADMITSMPRAATLSVMTQMLEDPAAEAVVGKLSTDPAYFGPAAARRIERAFIDERVNLSTTIEELMQDRDFRQKFEALQ